MENKASKTDFVRGKDEHGEFYLIPLSGFKKKTQFFAKIDPEDFADISQFHWTVANDKKQSKLYYAQRIYSLDGKRHCEKMHRRIMKVPPGVLVDHKNGDGLENRKYNLRVATVSENNQNQKPGIRGKNKYKGATWDKACKKWRAQICYHKKLIWLGYFTNEVDAAMAYDNAAIKYFGSFACLNFPEKRNIVHLKDGDYKMSYVMSEQDVQNIEKKLNDLKNYPISQIFLILKDKGLDEIVNMCHYFGCGISELPQKIRHFSKIKKPMPMFKQEIEK
ncbi:MAG: hypothetical protein A2167_08685 [Planctomycetes bacterium RBG_13_46_10]|nr:MAG: hypothetical protein A2167_08685 [Planctomycetes bacterium RBG_13_46_10]